MIEGDALALTRMQRSMSEIDFHPVVQSTFFGKRASAYKFRWYRAGLLPPA